MIRTKLISVAFCLSAATITAGCAHSIHESQTSDFREMKAWAPQIEAASEQFVIMGFVTDTNYVNSAFNELQTKCPGRITGITTKYSTSLGFFSWTNKIRMTGYCIRN